MKKIIFIGIVMCACLTGCGGSKNKKTLTMQVACESRVRVTRIGVFGDDLAYNKKRGVYLIYDHKTKAEYIGISGIGVVDISGHKSGKHTEDIEQ